MLSPSPRHSFDDHQDHAANHHYRGEREDYRRGPHLGDINQEKKRPRQQRRGNQSHNHQAPQAVLHRDIVARLDYGLEKEGTTPMAATDHDDSDLSDRVECHCRDEDGMW